MPGRTELLQRENHHSGRITFVYFPPKNPSGAPIFREESGISESSPVLATIPAQFSSTDFLVLNQRFARGHSQHPRERSQIRDGQVLKVPESLAVGWEQKKARAVVGNCGAPFSTSVKFRAPDDTSETSCGLQTARISFEPRFSLPPRKTSSRPE